MIKLFFISIFRKTLLIASGISIAYHTFYFDIYDFPYLLTIQIGILIMWIFEVIGMILYWKNLGAYTSKKVVKNSKTLFKSYTTIKLLFCYSLPVYLSLPKRFMLPNILITLLFGIYLGYRMAIKNITNAKAIEEDKNKK